MRRPISDISAADPEIRAPKPRASASASKGSFRDHLSAVRKEDVFNATVSPLLRSKAFHAGRNPMKFGIMQSTLKDYDPNGRIARQVSELDEKKAQQIYRMIWERAGCGRLSPELASEHFAAYIRRPRTAHEALQKSGGDPGNYAAAIKSANNKISYADGHSAKQSLGKAAEVTVSTINLQKSRVVASLKTAENPAVRQAAMNNVMLILPQASGPEINNNMVQAMHKAEDGSALENAGREPGNSEHIVRFKPVMASEGLNNAQSEDRKAQEIQISDSAMMIAIEKRDLLSGVNAYERAKTGKVLADGLFVKLKIPL